MPWDPHTEWLRSRCGAHRDYAGWDFPASRAMLGGHKQELAGDEADLPPKEAKETTLARWRDGLEAPAPGRADTAAEGANRNEGSSRKVREEGKYPPKKPGMLGLYIDRLARLSSKLGR